MHWSWSESALTQRNEGSWPNFVIHGHAIPVACHYEAIKDVTNKEIQPWGVWLLCPSHHCPGIAGETWMTSRTLICLQFKTPIPNFHVNRTLLYLNACLKKKNQNIFQAEEIPPCSQNCVWGLKAGGWNHKMLFLGHTGASWCQDWQFQALCAVCFASTSRLLAGLQLWLKASIWCLGRATIRVSADRLGYHMLFS